MVFDRKTAIILASWGSGAASKYTGDGTDPGLLLACYWPATDSLSGLLLLCCCGGGDRGRLTTEPQRERYGLHRYQHHRPLLIFI